MSITRRISLLLGLAVVSWLAQAQAQSFHSEMKSIIEADWTAQEKRLGTVAGSRQSIEQAIKRTELMLADLSGVANLPDLSAERAALARVCERAATIAAMDDAGRLAFYREIRWIARQAAMKNPLLAGRPILFMKRNRFACQMLHEHVAYFNQYSDTWGGGVFVLEEPGRSMKARDLIGDRLPEGAYISLSVSHDAHTAYFSYAPRTAPKPEFGSRDQRYYHIYAMDLRTNRLRQLTRESFDDTDPRPLPDGGIAFLSTRRGGFTRCNNPWEPIAVYTLHRMDADGSNIRALSFHETNEWHPNVLNDGRIVYTRWDYVDRSAAHYHGLWAMNADGSNPVSLFGNYTSRISACYQATAIPGSQRIMFVAGAHHADVGGSLVILDPALARLDHKSGVDRFESLERLTPEICFPEGDGRDGGWPDSYFFSPYPLSEKYYIVAFGHGKIPGMSSGGKRDTTGIYYFDRFGNLELLYRDTGIGSMYPIPLAPREMEPVVASGLDATLGDQGVFMLSDVSRSHLPFPPDRPIRSLRIYQVLPKTTPAANDPRIGHANAESARMLLGSVPVEADGSAHFIAPARKPLYFQAVDAEGRAVQGMRTITYLQPGERRGCVGCHEPMGSTASAAKPMALTRPPSKIAPGPDGTRPFSFPLLVQPVLDKHCVGCHDGAKGKGLSPPVLTGESDGHFSRSYRNLRPYLRWYEWGGDSIGGTVTVPGRQGTDESRLTGILADATHSPKLKLSPEDRERLYVWMDGNVPFYGVYDPKEQARQKQGHSVRIPQTQ